MTFNPGQWPYQAAKHCECCAATPAAQPLGPLKKNTKNAFEDQIRSFSLLFCVSPEYNRNIDCSARHVKGFRRGIDDLSKNID